MLIEDLTTAVQNELAQHLKGELIKIQLFAGKEGRIDLPLEPCFSLSVVDEKQVIFAFQSIGQVSEYIEVIVQNETKNFLYTSYDTLK